MEFHCITVHEAPSDEVELSTTSSTSTRRSSSSTTSSESRSSPVSPLPNDRPPPLQESVPITIAPATAPSERRPSPRLTREQVLQSLKESIPHTIRLRQLQKLERTCQKEASTHKKQVRRLSKELYVVVSLYALLLGVLFSAVAQSSVFSCADLWGLIVMAIAVTIGTIFSVSDKLRLMGIEKQEARMSERRQSAVYDKINQLYVEGSHCDIETLEPEHTMSRSDAPGVQCISSLHGLLVMGFLVGFSVLIMIACKHMLCRSCYCKK